MVQIQNNMPPKISIYDDYESMSQAAAARVIELLDEKPNAVICLPSGSTPRGMFYELVSAHESGRADFSKCTFIGLDEWVGLGAADNGSCRDLLDKDFLLPIGFNDEQIVFFNGLAENPQAECDRVNIAVATVGGLDLIVLGVGMNGHLALNEPGTPFDIYAHVSELDPMTVQVGQKYFKKETRLTRGITVGIGHILGAKSAILIASGKGKASVIQRALSLPVTTDFPATALQSHSNAEFILDRDAAELL
jgi:glucosamine-6-phosphate isomerase